MKEYFKWVMWQLKLREYCYKREENHELGDSIIWYGHRSGKEINYRIIY